MRVAIVSAYFNPLRSVVMLQNHRAFVAAIEKHSDCLTIVEGVFDGVTQAKASISVPCRFVMWQKERLLNLAISRLIEKFDAIAWIDGDVIFENPEWLEATAETLQRCDVAQIFQQVRQSALPEQSPVTSYASNVTRARELAGADFNSHGHTGYAWAARREVLANGLFDECIIGGADHVMAHAFTGTGACRCVSRLLGKGALRRRFSDWCNNLPGAGQMLRLGVVPGTITHLSHGSFQRRQYVTRNVLLDRMGFDPGHHLKRVNGGAWEWTENADKQRRLLESYFEQRCEDEIEHASR
ncbi:hypothetical protein [uncultured Roseibium sp.]|uniref:hypothetical protein n=1 Tax=uncultured Roseibium sp. TaxID=1936171 RepID=UPI00261F8738|nr:hypothetical protein [uncultured Roseibium sp.]